MLEEFLVLVHEQEPARNDIRRAQQFAGQAIHHQHHHHHSVVRQLFAVAQNNLADAANIRASINKSTACGHIGATLNAVRANHQHIAVAHNQNIPTLEAHRQRQIAMLHKMPRFAVNRNQILRACQTHHQTHLVTIRVSRHVNPRGVPVIVNISPQSIQIVNHPVNIFFVARDKSSAQNHRIAAIQIEILMVANRKPIQRAHRFALTARAQQNQLLGRQLFRPCRVNHDFVRVMQHAKRSRDSRITNHVQPIRNNKAPVFPRNLKQQLYAMQRGRERRENNLLLGLLEQLFQWALDGRFALAVAFLIRVRRIRQKRDDLPLLAQMGKGMIIKYLAVNRHRVNLVIARVHNITEGQMNHYRQRAHNRVRDMNCRNRQMIIENDFLARFDRAQVCGGRQAVFLQAGTDNLDCQL